MMNLRFVLFLVLLTAANQTRADSFDWSRDLNVPSQKFVLSNGLTLIVHEDHKAPIVAVNLWYHVGSKNERPGKTGFAHLFEHLMFTGSEHLSTGHNQRAFFQTMESLGATDLNGTTSEDRTDFFENVPTNALDDALWMESDRMGHLLAAVDQVKLDEQRGVVQNEKRQNENQPYGGVEELIVKATAPAGHPYSWTVIGSMDDLNAASLDDVRQWFKTYYGAANAVLVLAGDIQPQDALAKVKKYFDSIPSGPPLARFTAWTAPMAGPRTETAQDRVSQTRVYEVWNVPRYGEADTTYLDLLSSVLAQGKTSRLYKRLVYDEQIATDVSADVDEREINSQFTITATLRAGRTVAEAKAAIAEEVYRILDKGPSVKELELVRTEYFAQFARSLERMGGFGGVSDILAMNQTYRGTPDFYKTVLQQVQNSTPKNLREAGSRWLGGGRFDLHILPFPEYVTATNEVDRTHLPAPGSPPPVEFPPLQRASLANGLKIILVHRAGLPLISFNLLVNAGYASDQFAAPGTASLAMDMLKEGTSAYSSLQLDDRLGRLGAELSTSSDLDFSTVHLSALKSQVTPALALYASVILHPSFPAGDFRRLQQERLAEIEGEKTEPHLIALRLLPGLLFGPGHAYGNSFTGSGTSNAVAGLTPADIAHFHQTWFKPNNATLTIAGDTTLPEILPKLEKLFGGWKPSPVPVKNIGPVSEPEKPQIYLVDRPGSIQSAIMAADIAPSTGNPDEIALETMNSILGGAFTSRLNMNLREDKHWSYGVRSSLVSARGPSAFMVRAPVQTDKTREALIEMKKELTGFLKENPVTEEELATAKKDLTLKLPGQWETLAHLSSAVAQIVRFNWPDDYFNTYPERVRALTSAEIGHAAQLAVHPNHMIWLVVGDRAKIEPGLRELNWGNVHQLDPNGNPVK